MAHQRVSDILFLAGLGIALGAGPGGASSALAAERPVAVSPGSERGALIGDGCPTFSWGEVEGARRYELVVYRVSSDEEESRPVLRKTFPGTVESWTPSLRQCLEQGGRYAWSVRAVGGDEASEWSAPSLFEVASGPSEAEFDAAVEVVRSYLALRGENAESAPRELGRSSQQEGPASSESPTPLAPPAATQLSVDGNIDATSYTGDGENLANVATDAELATHTGLADAHREHATLEESSEIDADILAHAGAADAHHAPTVDTFVTNKDAHDHLGGDGAAVLHSSLGSVGASDHHAPFENPDGPCFDATRRFADCGNGTVTDTVTGLIYLKNANCFGTQNWVTANQSAAGLADGACGLSDGSRAGDWRLQTKEEWEGIVDPSCTTDPEIVGNQSPTPGCYTDAGDAASEWASGVVSSGYWSSTTNSSNSTFAWIALLSVGDVFDLNFKTGDIGRVWPVRGGQ